MATQTDAPLSAAWLYDELMQHIEPDLLTANVGHLDETYAGETDAQRTERLEKYAIAFRIFTECLEEITDMSLNDVVLMSDTMKLIASGQSSSDLPHSA